ncbi:MAG: insulinase family protein [Candidatus Obscuribacterales bacterium]|nr:insulinase family protein [Steroidobacteraceae bacterium]
MKQMFAGCLAAMVTLAAPAAPTGQVKFTEYTLKNGLRVQLSEDRTTPVVAIHVTYDVGSRNERAGRTGFAHLFEHMMFKGSANVGDGEHFYQILTQGGSMNGTTSSDRTVYFETLPAHQIELGLFLEADRMRSLAITQENLDNQRNAVQEERRQSLDNQPYGKAFERHQQLMYDNFAYKHSVIGSMEDLNAATVEDVNEFFKTYYAPNNAVLTLVGDFKSAAALKLIKKYFEAIPQQPAPPAVDIKEAPQTAERRDSMDDPLARLSRVYVGYKAVPGNTHDYFALEVLAAVLQDGQSSRLYKSLVQEKQLSVGAGAFIVEQRAVGPFYLIATVIPGKKPEDVEAAMYAEIERIQREPIAEWELTKAVNGARTSYFSGIRSSQSRAAALGINKVFYNDANVLNTYVEQMKAVTRADVQRVARQYLQPTNRTVLTVVAKGGTAASR